MRIRREIWTAPAFPVVLRVSDHREHPFRFIVNGPFGIVNTHFGIVNTENGIVNTPFGIVNA